MTNLLLIAFQNNSEIDNFNKKIKKLSNLITPNNIKARDPISVKFPGVHMGLINPISKEMLYNNSIHVGLLLKKPQNWNKPKGKLPDGSYGLFRVDESKIELITDFVGSRTIWYYFDQEKIIASTSQRAIIFFLKSFIPNKKAQVWMLSSGSIGPRISWDKRIKVLPPNSVLSLDRAKWKYTVMTPPVKFQDKKEINENLNKEFQFAIEDNFKRYSPDLQKFLFLLSGGYDSRGVLYLLKKHNRISQMKCLCWGMESSLKNKKSDSSIAKELANKLDLDFEFLPTNLDDNIKKVFERFVKASEGRVDDIAGYLDGFDIWKKVYEQKFSGIIRSDEGFGWSYATTKKGARRSILLFLFSDYTFLKDPRLWGYEYKQNLPNYLKKRNTETVAQWRDRLYHQYRIPTVLSALNHIKSLYVEIHNPLLTETILKTVRRLPDEYRTNKEIWKAYVKKLGNKNQMPIAKYPAIQEVSEVLNLKAVKELFIKKFNSEPANVLPNEVKDYVLSHLGEKDEEQTLISIFQFFLKKLYLWVREKLLRNFTFLKGFLFDRLGKISMDINLFAFRAYIIIKINEILENDSKILINLK